MIRPWNCTFIPLPLFCRVDVVKFGADAVDAVISHTEHTQERNFESIVLRVGSVLSVSCRLFVGGAFNIPGVHTNGHVHMDNFKVFCKFAQLCGAIIQNPEFIEQKRPVITDSWLSRDRVVRDRDYNDSFSRFVVSATWSSRCGKRDLRATVCQWRRCIRLWAYNSTIGDIFSSLILT